MWCTFQVDPPSPNPNPNVNTNTNPIASALHDWPNIVQFVNCCIFEKLISSTAHLVKCAIDQMCATYPYRIFIRT